MPQVSLMKKLKRNHTFARPFDQNFVDFRPEGYYPSAKAKNLKAC